MKIRNGFVSNSSSSSFVVAFPKKPKNAKDVQEFMFKGKEGGLSAYDYDGLSYAQVSSTVFDDIKRGNAKKATKKDIVEIFNGRYHYYPNNHNVFWNGRITDEDGGAWTGKLGRYYGNNQKLMQQLKEVIVEDESRSIELQKEEFDMVEKGVGKQPKYAYKGGTDSYTNKPYTDDDIKKQEVYQKKREHFTKTDEKYLAFNKKKWADNDVKWKKTHDLSDKIAEEDAQNFMDDNKGKFIFIVSYSDNDGQNGCTMEHGNIFRHVPHVVISQH